MITMNSLFLEYESIKTKKDHMKVGNYFYWNNSPSEGLEYPDNDIEDLYERTFKIANIKDYCGKLIVDYYYLPISSVYPSYIIYYKSFDYILKYAEPCPEDMVKKIYEMYPKFILVI